MKSTSHTGILLALAAFGFAAHSAAAANIAVKNGLFHIKSTPASRIPDWTTSTNKGNFGIYTDQEKYPAGKGVPAGSGTAYVGDDPKNVIQQPLDARFIAGHTYTLTAYSGESNGAKGDHCVFGFYNASKLPPTTPPSLTDDLYHGAFTATAPGYTLKRVSYTASKAVNDDKIGIYFLDLGHGTETVHIADVSVSVRP